MCVCACWLVLVVGYAVCRIAGIIELNEIHACPHCLSAKTKTKTHNTPPKIKVSLEHQVLLDPTEQELRSQQSDAQVSVAYMPSRDQVNFVQASGDWSMHSFKDYMDTCLDGCKKMQPILRSCLVETMRTKQLDA